MPHRVAVRRGEPRRRHGRAPARAEDALGEEVVSEQRRHQQVLPEEPLEERPRQHVPRDRIRDGGENPIELPQRRLAVALLPRDGVGESGVEPRLGAKRRVEAEPPEGHLHRAREARREDVGLRREGGVGGEAQ